MILKKPYAFFIKNFKLFHFIIFAISAILLYKTSLIYDFMRQYVELEPNLIGKELTTSLYSPWLYILIAVLILVNILIIVIMIKKEKPYMYYIINISLYVGVLITYVVSNGVINDLEKIVVSSKTTLAIRDILNIARLLQTVSMFFYLVRSTGFDIKKFDFVKDLQSLDISEEDSEEIEVSIEFEKNVFIRNIRKKIRNAKYYYKENRFILNIIMALTISLIFLLVYLSANKYDKIYSENEFFNAGTITIGVKETNITKNNYKNEKIVSDDYSLVVVKISAKSYEKDQLQQSRMMLVIDNQKYYSTNKYDGELIDLGNTYRNEELSEEMKDYTLVYEIPKEKTNSNMIFRYIDGIDQKRGKTIINSMDVSLNPKKIDEQKSVTNRFELENEIDLGNTKLEGYKSIINNFEIKEKFENTYNSCITNKECYDFKEIITPSVTTNNEKVLLKIKGKIEYEKSIGNITNLYELIEKYATIEYTYNGKDYTEKNDFLQVTPKRTKETETYYIEIDKNILNAEKIKLSLNIRNIKYELILKGEY